MYKVIQAKNADIKNFFKKNCTFCTFRGLQGTKSAYNNSCNKKSKKSKKLFVKSNSYSVVIVKRKDSSRKVAEKEGQEVKKTI